MGINDTTVVCDSHYANFLYCKDICLILIVAVCVCYTVKNKKKNLKLNLAMSSPTTSPISTISSVISIPFTDKGVMNDNIIYDEYMSMRYDNSHIYCDMRNIDPHTYYEIPDTIYETIDEYRCKYFFFLTDVYSKRVRKVVTFVTYDHVFACLLTNFAIKISAASGIY